MTWIRDNTRFLVSFLRHPRAVGSIVPSSRWLADRLVRDLDLGSAETVVELGPGTGACTRAILNHVGPRTLVLAVELNALFARRLADRFPAIRVVNGSAEHLADHLAAFGRASADSVVSSLPWASFPEDLQKRLMDSIVESLRPGGRFVTYAYVHATWMPGARRFRKMLESRFREVVRAAVVWRNVPPALVYRCRK